MLFIFNIEISYILFLLRDLNNKDKYFNNDLIWNKVEVMFEKVLKDMKVNYIKVEGEVVFYGFKIDI